MSTRPTSYVTILSSAELLGYFEVSRGLKRAQHEGRLITALVQLGSLVRVSASTARLTAQDLERGCAGVLVGVQLAPHLKALSWAQRCRSVRAVMRRAIRAERTMARHKTR